MLKQQYEASNKFYIKGQQLANGDSALGGIMRTKFCFFICIITSLASQSFAGSFMPAQLLEAKHVAEVHYLSLLQQEFSGQIQYINMDSMQGKYNLVKFSHLNITAQILTASGDYYECYDWLMILKQGNRWVPRMDKRGLTNIHCSLVDGF